METSDDGVHGRSSPRLARVIHDVHDPRVAAAGDHHQPLRGLDDDRGVLRDRVLDETARRPHLQRAAPVALGMNARHGAGEPDSRHQLPGLLMDDEDAAHRLVRGLQGQQAVRVLAVGVRNAEAFGELVDLDIKVADFGGCWAWCCSKGRSLR